MANQPHFDVFLAHHSQDKPQVRSIATKLEQRGLKVWLDEDQIPPGQPFQDVIQQAIQNVRAAAIFIGSGGLGNWERLELRTLLSQFVDKAIPVIPVLLPGVERIPRDLSFLQDLNWVRFANGLDDEEALTRLVRGITQQHPTVLPQTSRHFDVLLFYNDEDNQEVQPIIDQLRERQIQLWLTQEVRGGDTWQRTLETDFAQIYSVAVFIGQSGSLWNREQIEPFIEEFIAQRRPVIPVILPNLPQEPELPIYLRRRTKVDFRQQDPDPMEQLLRGITENRPTPSPPVSSPEVKVIGQLDNQSPKENNSRSRNVSLGKLVPVLGVITIPIAIAIGIVIGQNWKPQNSDNNQTISEFEVNKNICQKEGNKTLESLGLDPSQYNPGKLVYDRNVEAGHNAWNFVCRYIKKTVKGEKIVIIEVGLDLDTYCASIDPQLVSEASKRNSDQFSFNCEKR